MVKRFEIVPFPFRSREDRPRGLRTRVCGGITQLVECQLCKLNVTGPNPVASTTGRVAQLVMSASLIRTRSLVRSQSRPPKGDKCAGYARSTVSGRRKPSMLFDICVWKERKQRKREARLKTSAKRIRAHDGCLGIMRRRRTRQTAISCGEESISIDPQISEWGNPVSFIGHCTGMNSIVPAARHPGK